MRESNTDLVACQSSLAILGNDLQYLSLCYWAACLYTTAMSDALDIAVLDQYLTHHVGEFQGLRRAE